MTPTLKRLEVSGGFLSDLDIEFVPGLNVIIGPRGAGKTSVLELLRYAFGVEAITPEADQRARRHALDVLVDGSVAVTMEDGPVEVIVSRDGHSGADAAPVGLAAIRPLVVSQREIEEIGLDARSRLQILDGLVLEEQAALEEPLLERVAVIGAENDRLLESVDRVRTRLIELVDVPDLLRVAESEAAAQGAASASIEGVQANLKQLSASLDHSTAASSATDRVVATATGVRDLVEHARQRAAGLDVLDPSSPAAVYATRGIEHLTKAFEEFDRAVDASTAEAASRSARVVEIRRSLRDAGQKLEVLQVGAGDLARRLTNLREQDGERRALESSLEATVAELEANQQRRDSLLDDLDALREQRFERRKRGARLVKELFNGEIEIRLTKSGLFRDYESSLASALEGSGLQHRALARQLASRISPRELVEAVERGSAREIANVGQITAERAERLVAFLRANGSASVLTAPLEDAVDFALLDGQQYKPTAELSTGQRCTVVLPLLLGQQAQVTILDQPEDHLDNAFIVETLVRAVLAHKPGRQLIIATHNANIPVLGAAEKVIVLGSDGRHGGVEHAGPLDDPTTVNAVTAIMEGGEDAFRRRANFYADNG